MLKLKPRNSQRSSGFYEFPEERRTQPLFELSFNTPNLPSSSNPKHITKRNLFAKKSLNLKFQKAQLDHCCIDIVNRRPMTQKQNENEHTKKEFKASNIALLKKEIEYLQRDRLKWQKFPKEEAFMKTTKLQPVQNEEQPKPIEIRVHSLEQVVADNNRSMLLQGLFSTFDRNFYIAPLKERPLTSDQKRVKEYFSTAKKKSLKKCGAIDTAMLSGYDRDNLRKTIHNKTDLSSPFKRYFVANRSRRNSSCGAQVVGQKMKKHTYLSFQGITTI